MLAQDVCWRAHLKVVDEVIIRDEVRVPVLDDVARVATEEERLRRTTRCRWVCTRALASRPATTPAYVAAGSASLSYLT